MDASRPGTSAKIPRLSHRVEAWAVALVFGALGLLPIDWASDVGGRLGRLFGPFLGVSKRARINLRQAFPELSDVAISRIIVGMWDNLGRVATQNTRTSQRSAYLTRAGGSRPMASSIWTGLSRRAGG
jgi:Kdo2-lipid IVA lauroyltransferase/acyltransferase